MIAYDSNSKRVGAGSSPGFARFTVFLRKFFIQREDTKQNKVGSLLASGLLLLLLTNKEAQNS
jgi:hypothetical protein